MIKDSIIIQNIAVSSLLHCSFVELDELLKTWLGLCLPAWWMRATYGTVHFCFLCVAESIRGTVITGQHYYIRKCHNGPFPFPVSWTCAGNKKKQPWIEYELLLPQNLLHKHAHSFTALHHPPHIHKDGWKPELVPLLSVIPYTALPNCMQEHALIQTLFNTIFSEDDLEIPWKGVKRQLGLTKILQQLTSKTSVQKWKSIT